MCEHGVSQYGPVGAQLTKINTQLSKKEVMNWAGSKGCPRSIENKGRISLHCFQGIYHVRFWIPDIFVNFAPTRPYCDTPCSLELTSFNVIEYICWFSVAYGKNTKTPYRIRFFFVISKIIAIPSIAMFFI